MLSKITCLLLLLGIVSMPVLGQDNFCEDTDSLDAKLYSDEAKKFFRANKIDKAVEYFQKAKEEYQQLGCSEKVFNMNGNILKVCFFAKQYDKFHELCTTLIAEVATPKDTEEAIHKGELLYLKSRVLFLEGKYQEATTVAKSAATIHEKHGAWQYYLEDYLHLGLIAMTLEDWDRMEVYADRSYAVYKEHNLVQDRDDVMRMYGALYYKTGNYAKALEKTMDALESAQQDTTEDNTQFIASCYNNIGLFYIELGDIYKAEDYCKGALRLYKELGMYLEAGTTYLNLGEFFAHQGKLENALDYYKEGLVSLEKATVVGGQEQHKEDKTFIHIYNGIGEVATQLKRFPEAINALNKSLEIHKREPAQLDKTYSVLGMYYEAQGNYDKAVNYYEEALGLRMKLYGEKHPLIAQVYFELGQVADKKHENVVAMSYYNLAKAALSFVVDTTNAINVDEVTDKDILLEILDAKARLLLEEGKTEEAYTNAQSAVLILEKIRNAFKEEGSKLFIVQKMIPTYELCIELSLKLFDKTGDERYKEAAFELVEKSKAMLLLDAMKTEAARSFGNVPKDLLEEEGYLARERVRYEKLLFEAKTANDRAAIDLHQEKLLELKRTFEKLQNTLEKDYPKYHELKYNTATVGLKTIQQKLDPNTGLIEFFIGNKYIYIFCVSKDNASIIPVEITNQFQLSIKGLRKALTDLKMLVDDERSSYLLLAKNARTVYQNYLEPALKTMDVERLILIPDGLLNYVPFDVLLTEKPNYQKVDFKALPYLIKQYTINYHYSSTLKFFERKKVSTNGKMLAMASSYNKKLFVNRKDLTERHQRIRSSVGDLPGAKREVENLANSFNGQFLYGEDANEAAFKSIAQTSPYTVIHLAMHGVVDSKRPEYSSLVLSYTEDQEEDDLLHAYELNLLDINTELVVLSACETGFGKYERGEGVVSLGRGFMYAGAPSLAMTLWPINDKATSIFITEFYAQLAEGYAKDEAMRIAKNNYINSTIDEIAAHPFFWASFIHLGDYTSIQLLKRWPIWYYILIVLIIGGLLSIVLRKKQ